jgi:hypothetical protein
MMQSTDLGDLGDPASIGGSPLIDGKLMPEGEDLDLHGEPGPDEAMDEGEHGA